MIAFSDRCRANWPRVSTMSSVEYLGWRVNASMDELVDRLRRVTPQTGVEAAFREGVLQFRLSNRALFRQLRATQGFSTDWIDSEMKQVDTGAQDVSMDKLSDDFRNIGAMSLGMVTGNRSKLASVPIGVAAPPVLNGFAGPVPTGGAYIMLNYGLTQLKYWLGLLDVFIDCCRSANPEDIASKAFPLLSSMVKFAAHSLGRVDVSQRVPQWAWEAFFAKEQVSKNVGLVYWFAVAFVLLHEYGHIQCGHVDRLRSDPLSAEDYHSFEYEADQFAADAYKNEARNAPSILFNSILGLFLMLNCSAWPDLEPGGTDTHPPVRDRFIRIVSRLSTQPEADHWVDRFDLFVRAVNEAEHPMRES